MAKQARNRQISDTNNILIMRKSFLLAALAAILLAILTPWAAAAPGDLDTTFGGTGKVTTAVVGNSYGYSVALQTDGKIVLAGACSSGAALAACRP